MEAIGLFVVIIGVLVVMVAVSAANSAARRKEIHAKYGHNELAEAIIARRVWVGQTPEQLIDSKGRPHDIDEKRLKTKSKEIWKYHHRGGNRYGLRITVENGEVVGWDEKL